MDSARTCRPAHDGPAAPCRNCAVLVCARRLLWADSRRPAVAGDNLGAVPLRDPRPLARSVVALVALAAFAQILRVAFRVWEYRDASAIHDLIVSPDSRPGDTAGGRRTEGWVLAEALLVILILIPLQLLVIGLWLMWQRRLRRNAAALPSADTRLTVRRLGVLMIASGLVVAANVALIAADRATQDERVSDRTLVAAELSIDVLILALMVVVAWTTARWTQEQDRLVQHRR